MYNFKTAEELADKWGISTRYVQSLCRQGKIEGAVKRAGIWFIPETAANSRNKKSNGRYLRFNGTKKKIFEKAVEMFAENSYEVITLKDIADAVGIRQSAIYNHFKSKQEILDVIYDFYCHYTADKPTLEELETVLRNGSLMDIMNCVVYSFRKECLELLIDIDKILFYRLFIDERAREIAKVYTLKAGIDFVKAVFDRAVKIGRLAPFNTHLMALFLNSLRMSMFQILIIDNSPKVHKKWLEDEQRLLRCAVDLLIDLKPPASAK